MDSITQAVLGAAIGEATLGNKIGVKAAIIGAVIATIPDLDVLLYLYYDKFEMLSIHRGISHSFLFSFLASFLIAFVISKMKFAKHIIYTRLWLFVWLALTTHILLDVFTAYGTQVFLPFSNHRLGFDSINIVDPIYTVPLIVGLVFSLWGKRKNTNQWFPISMGLFISTLYLLSTLVTKQVVEHRLKADLVDYSIGNRDLLTIPVGVASLNWYGVAKSEDSIFMRKYNLINGLSSSLESFPINEHLLFHVDKEVADKMKWFAKGFYSIDEYQEKIRFFNLQVDMRGIIKTDSSKAPTAGYFELSKNGDKVFDSGSIR